jgi:DNA-binding NarL/FixJ family response regulator
VELEEIRSRWPSTTWGEDEWYAVLEARPDICDALLGAIAHVNMDTAFAKQVWAQIQRNARRRRPVRVPRPPRYWPMPQRVLHSLAYGLDIPGLALMYGLGEETVKTHLAQLRAAYDRERTAGLAVRELKPELPPLPRPYVQPRARDVLVGTALGLSQAGIAQRNGTSWKTVKSWRARLHDSFDVQHSVALVAAGYASGALKLGEVMRAGSSLRPASRCPA